MDGCPYLGYIPSSGVYISHIGGERRREVYIPQEGVYTLHEGIYHQMGVYTIIWYLDKTLIGDTPTIWRRDVGYIPQRGGG